MKHMLHLILILHFLFAASEIWLLLLTLSLLSLLLLLLLLLSMLAITLDTAVAETTAKVRNPVREKTLSCFSMHLGFGHLASPCISFFENHSCFHFHKVNHLMLHASFAPKEAVVERERWRNERIRRRRAIGI